MMNSTRDMRIAHRDWCEFRMLDAIEKDPNVSQRALARTVGMAVGRTNQMLKRLVHQGHVRMRRVNAKRMVYQLTARGSTRKLQLITSYANDTIGFFASVRTLVRTRLLELQRSRHLHSVVIVGTTPLAEAVYLSVLELGLKLVAVVDDERAGNTWLGQPVSPLSQCRMHPADAIILAELEAAALPHPPWHASEAEVVDLVSLLSDRLCAYTPARKTDPWTSQTRRPWAYAHPR